MPKNNYLQLFVKIIIKNLYDYNFFIEYMLYVKVKVLSKGEK